MYVGMADSLSGSIAIVHADVEAAHPGVSFDDSARKLSSNWLIARLSGSNKSKKVAACRLRMMSVWTGVTATRMRQTSLLSTCVCGWREARPVGSVSGGGELVQFSPKG